MDTNEKTLSGICCEVENCVHNDGHCCCTAQEVTVKARTENPEDTRCDTFTEI